MRRLMCWRKGGPTMSESVPREAVEAALDALMEVSIRGEAGIDETTETILQAAMPHLREQFAREMAERVKAELRGTDPELMDGHELIDGPLGEAISEATGYGSWSEYMTVEDVAAGIANWLTADKEATDAS